LIKRKEIIGADIVEVAPRENDYLTQWSSARLCYQIIGDNLLKRSRR
jgi:arginase family enzyme